MAKKQKRTTTTPEPAAPVVERPAASVRARSGSTEFNPDYSYVINDLKRIGTLAGSFIIILVVLSFFLR